VKAGTPTPAAVPANTPSNSKDWREKYYDSLSSLEGEQKKFQAMEAVLKRLAGRLCTAALGQSPRLDNEIKKLQAAIRREASNDELDKITPTLTEAINALDESAGASSTATQPVKIQSEPGREIIAGDERVRAILAALIAELRRDAELVIQVDALDAKLVASVTRDQLPEVLSALTELVGKRIERLERAKREIEALLSQMVGRLDEISRYIADQSQNQTQALASSETLNTHLVGEMKAMGDSVESAGDLQLIRTQVRSRLDSIGRHLLEFRQREATLAGSIRERNEQMRARVTEQEAEANRLHGQLKDEQRQSLIDVLTKVPNRLAYEKRIEEELKRWQRFKQPTCLAAWDIDHFKKINDTYGHRAGDRVLSAVAECLASRIRGTDFLARYGGEEFVMILCGTNLSDAVRLIDEIRVVVEKLKFHSHGTPLAVTMSSGVTAIAAGDSAGAAFERADKALYQAKSRGRNCVVGA